MTLNEIEIISLSVFLIVIFSLVFYGIGKICGVRECVDENIKNNKKLWKHEAGTLVINTTDPDKDVMRFELAMSIGEIINTDFVIFTVKDESKKDN